ncbi:MAG: YceI family protein [candidate division WOR-3 bacterium]
MQILIFTYCLNYEVLNSSSKITFKLSATLHEVFGNAENINSEIYYDGDSISGYVKVLSKSLKTGNSIRDAQMYKVINSDKYQFIEFIPDSLRDSKIFGKFRLSGVERYLIVPINLNFSSDLANVSGNFIILLSSFNLKRPKFGFLEVSDTVNIDFNLVYKCKK